MITQARFSIEDHPADVAVRAWGSTIEETLSNLCRGMWSLIAPPETVPAEETLTVRSTGKDMEELVVNMLTDQIIIAETEGFIAGQVVGVALEKVGDTLQATAELRGCRARRLKEPVSCPLKAATYHELLVSPNEVRVVFDA